MLHICTWWHRLLLGHVAKLLQELEINQLLASQFKWLSKHSGYRHFGVSDLLFGRKK